MGAPRPHLTKNGAEAVEHRILPTAEYIARCPRQGCRWSCNHPTLKTATACVEDHDRTHHQEQP